MLVVRARHGAALDAWCLVDKVPAMRLPLACALILTGCSATIGPYVADIQELPDGRFRIIRCTTEVSQTGQVTSYENGNCNSKVIGHPRSSEGSER